jgi:hypothetical protein
MRRAAIASLLRTGRPGIFRQRLQQSGSAFAWYLGQSQPGAVRLSDSAPFLDAVAAGDLATASEIARRSHHVWVATDEYEEDFLFYEFLTTPALGAEAAATGPALKLLVRWEAALAGTEDPRLGVCRALIGGESSGFDAALLDFLNARERQQREALDMQEPEAAATESSVSIEGLALRRLAVEWGLTPAAEHPQIPVAIFTDRVAWPGDSFRTIE